MYLFWYNVISLAFRKIFRVQLSWLIQPKLPADALSPGRPQWMCRGFPVLAMNTLYKTIFEVTLSYQLNDLSPLGGLNEEALNSLFKTIFLSTVLWTWCALSSRRPKQMFRGFPVHPLQNYLPSKPVTLTHWALPPRRHEQMCGSFPVCPLQDHLPRNTTVSI